MKISCFGEVLWDIFPKHKKIGGAPLNVALRLNSMGVKSSIITKVGMDDLGDAIISYIDNQGISSRTIQKDEKHPTGEVLVSLDDKGTASYEINHPVAWDFIETKNQAIKEVIESDAIIFGSLVSRSKISRNTLFELLEKAKFKILDVNLRPPHYTTHLLSELMKRADFIKLNDEELDEICTRFDINEIILEDQIKAIAAYTHTKEICVTKGAEGAVLFYNTVFYYNKGYQIKVVDSVGAGDSFLATLVSKLLQDNEPQMAIDYACAIGAMVAGREGANPVFSEDEIQGFIKN